MGWCNFCQTFHSSTSCYHHMNATHSQTEPVLVNYAALTQRNAELAIDYAYLDRLSDALLERNAELEGKLDYLQQPPTDGDAAYWHTAWKVLEAELQAKTAEVEKLRTRWWAVVAGFNTYQIEQHELNCDERDHEVAIFDRIGDIIFYAPDPHPSQGGGE